MFTAEKHCELHFKISMVSQDSDFRESAIHGDTSGLANAIHNVAITCDSRPHTILPFTSERRSKEPKRIPVTLDLQFRRIRAGVASGLHE
jgi:hypothetical protein